MIYEFLYPFQQGVRLGRCPQRASLHAVPRDHGHHHGHVAVVPWIAPWFIQKLRGKQISQIIREEGPTSHYAKRGTPTMGGALIPLSVLVPTVLWADVRNVFVVAHHTLEVTAGYGAVSFLDDRLKIVRQQHARSAWSLQVDRAGHYRRLRALLCVPQHAGIATRLARHAHAARDSVSGVCEAPRFAAFTGVFGVRRCSWSWL